jgi:hypothetical protein
MLLAAGLAGYVFRQKLPWAGDKSPAESMAEFTAALIFEDHATVKKYLTRPNLEYVERSGMLDSHAREYILKMILGLLSEGVKTPQGRRDISTRLVGNKLAVVVKVPGESSGPENFSLTVAFETEEMVGNRALVVVRQQPDLFGEKSEPRKIEMVRDENRWKPVKLIHGDDEFPMDLSLLTVAANQNVPLIRRAERQAAAVGSLRTIATANESYRKNYNVGYAPSLLALGPYVGQPTPEAAGLIDSDLASASKKGYLFTYQAGNTQADGTRNTYAVLADPDDPGDDHFYVDETGVIRRSDQGPAGPNSKAVD